MAVPSLNMRQILGGDAAAAVAGTLAHSIWKGTAGLFPVRLYVLFPYLAYRIPFFTFLLRPRKQA